MGLIFSISAVSVRCSCWVCDSVVTSRLTLTMVLLAMVWCNRDISPMDSEQSLRGFVLPKSSNHIHFWPIFLKVFQNSALARKSIV